MNQIQRPDMKKMQQAPAVKQAGDLSDEEIAAQLDAEEKAEVKAEVVETKKTVSKTMSKMEKKANKIKLSPIDVTATEVGFYGNRRIKVGDKFKLEDESDFSHNWMKKI